jgi:hypothetical protein
LEAAARCMATITSYPNKLKTAVGMMMNDDDDDDDDD